MARDIFESLPRGDIFQRLERQIFGELTFISVKPLSSDMGI